MAKFNVIVSTTVGTTMVIEAETAEEAVQRATDLAFEEGRFTSDVADGMSNDWEAYRVRNWDFECVGVAGDDEEAY
jgi:hypothetical protein